MATMYAFPQMEGDGFMATMYVFPQVEGDGFMATMVDGFLNKFNSKHKLDQKTSNHECLPDPSKTDQVIIGFIFAILVLVWLFIYVEALGLRTRWVIYYIT